MFAAAKDVAVSAVQSEVPAELTAETDPDDISYKQEHTPKETLDKVRNDAVTALAQREGVPLIAHKRAQFWSGDKSTRVVCPVSKRYRTGGYWYAFHPHQKAFISEASNGYLLLGCLDSEVTYAVPSSVIAELVPFLNTTESEDRMYWHIQLQPSDDGAYQLLVPKKAQRLNMKPFEISLAAKQN